MMNKMRIESLSDCVFSIVMTLLIIEIKVPHLDNPTNGPELVQRLLELWPLFRSYYISFAILGMYWIAHHTLFHVFAKHANRAITYLNILFLIFIALIPFSAHLIGQYPRNEIAVIVYGANVIVIGLVQYSMLLTTLKDPQAIHDQISPTLIMQAKVRMILPAVFAVFGIVAAPYNSALSFCLFAFPVIFNIIPWTLTALERVLGLLPRKP